MLDFHTHILHRIDDGPKSIEEAKKMLAMLHEQGCTSIVSTSHYDFSVDLDTWLDRRNRRIEVLNDSSIIKGAEVYYYDGISINNNLDKLCIEGTDILLLELPFKHFSNRIIDEVITLANLYTVVIAHIDRYMMFDNVEYLHLLKERGVLFQVNVEYFNRGLFKGKRIKELRKADFLDYIGSDCHDLNNRAPNIKEGYELLSKYCDSNFMEYLNKLVK